MLLFVASLSAPLLRAQETGHRTFGISCADCHAPSNWTTMKDGIKFSHGLTGFELTGKHATTTCNDCHAKASIGVIKGTCTTCHTSPHSGAMYAACATCHGTTVWKSDRDEVNAHQRTAFPLVGAHATAECSSCHAKQTPAQYASTSKECYSCHNDLYDNVSDPDHAKNGFDKNCSKCHTLDTDAGWAGGFRHPPVALRSTPAHVGVACAKCHLSGYKGTTQECYGCHVENYSAVRVPPHVERNFPHDCTRCHEPTTWKATHFDHSVTRFKLEGTHAAIPCNDCHGSSLTPVSMACIDCHEENYSSTKSPDHAKAGFPLNCDQCHSFAGWKPSKFDHEFKNFRLTGAHKTTPCESCHINGKYSNMPLECEGCHEKTYDRTSRPNHQMVGFPRLCRDCHNTNAWQPVERQPLVIDHDKTPFPLVGRHREQRCEQCHVNGMYFGTQNTCFGCHQRNYLATTSPNHSQGHFSQDCRNCHTMDGWQPAKFSHEATNFPLTGFHTTLACERCHVNGNFNLVFSECYQCHAANYNGTTSPNHAANLFPHDCSKCHNTTAFKPSTFNHATTNFPLQGAHLTRACADCHVNGNFQLVYTECFQCHAANYNGATNPNHVSGNFSHVCTTCHNFNAWQPANFSHNGTNFPLTGFHTTLACERCHVNGNFNLTFTDCYQCHQANYTAVQQPAHVAGQFPHDCTKCHNTTAFKPATFSHAATAFPLQGKHSQIACQECHKNGNYTPLVKDCFNCHQNDYQGVVTPNHVTGQFNHDCTVCHNFAAWIPTQVDHSRTNFPLTGTHLTLACEKCHVNGNFGLSYTGCYMCHQANYNAVQQPPHLAGQFPHDCTQCHNTTAFKPSTFSHASTKFPLQGVHATRPCQDCHVAGNFNLAFTECFQCHAKDYNGTTAPNHVNAKFSHDCTNCHSFAAWQPASFSHNGTNFVLKGKHTTLPCEDCHKNGNYNLVFTECYQCHAPDYNGVANPPHASNNFSHDCSKCHGFDAWKPATFDHAGTHFPLQGKHLTLQCSECHVGGNFNLTFTDCFQCHAKDYQGAQAPNHAAGNFPHTCNSCHGFASWQPAQFDHAKTNFPLTGHHLVVDCQQCHVGGNFNLVFTDCYQCHQANYTATVNPAHALNQFPHDCTKCHNTTAFKPSTFSHASTKFPLSGKHATLDCRQCHTNGNFALVFTDCYQCHASDFASVQTPNHVSSNFLHDCTECHSFNAWKPVTFDHNKNGFPYTGVHLTTPCAQCHVNGNFTLHYTDCKQCHLANYNGTTNPNHVQQNFPQDCARCHTPVGWRPATFDHTLTKFPLQGVHATRQCSDCHVNGNFQLVFTDCYQCHAANYNSVTNPNHVTSNLPHDCSQCHSFAGWKPTTFNHASTNFPLQGVHASQPCGACHVNGNFNLKFTDCYQCHAANYNGVTNPNHVTSNLPHDCSQCHSFTGWKPTTFNHATTNFPLTGTHLSQPCAACHVNGNFQLVFNSCYQCHASNYNSVQSPNHVQGQFPQDCRTCHNTTAFKPSTFNHASTKFPLTGQHLTRQCQDCHTGGNFSLSYTNCYQCHANDYNNATNPNHATNHFPTDCSQCHNPTGFTPSTFDHSKTAFALSGTHLTLQCGQCHVNGNFALHFTDCYQCHATDYNNQKNPDHAAGSFSHDCRQCHTTTAFKPSIFDHSTTAFPLTGTHASQACANCHINGNFNLTFTDCYQCHQANYTGVTNPNHVAGQFPHDCRTCHNTTAFKPSTFNHSSTKFALTGQHLTRACQDCHTNGNFNLVFTDCWQCHQATYNGATSPNHAAGQFPHDCTLCHTTAGFQPSTFNHASTKFPLTGHHATQACQTCHVNGNFNLVFTDCWQCHQTTYNGTTNPNHAAGQFPHDCTTCHTTAGWSPALFNHATTNFPLTGAHTTRACQDCHINGNFNLVFTECYQCHATNYAGVTNPNHVAGQFPHNCTQCHTTTAFNPSTFNHASTNFQLQGAHAAQQCQACHINGNFNLTYTNCIQCHQNDFNTAASPNHVSNQFPQTCTTCHNFTAWQPSAFQHSTTAFPLTGTHLTRPCIDCHVGGNYAITYTDCYGCHASNYNGTTSPNHASNQFPHTCNTCHNTTAWQPSTFNHATTNFPLQGAHTTRPCADCHVNGNFQLVYTNCYQCHAANYNAQTSPANHQLMNLDHNCATCHTQTAFNPATPFRTSHNVNAPNGFPIYSPGKHNNKWSTCNQCHTTNSTATYCCTNCHTQSSTNNNHNGVSGYSWNCTICTNCHPDGRAP